jgi:hypothetical protein
MSQRHAVTFASTSGFWGDSQFALSEVLASSHTIDFLISDYLSEVTLGLMAKMGQVHENSKYAKDFLVQYGPEFTKIAKRKIKVVTNAGGLDPLALGELVKEYLSKHQIDLKVAVVTGDSLAEPIHFLKEDFLSANAYLGAAPIASALNKGADIVITGRVADSSLVLGCAQYSFDWKMDQFDLLAQGSLAGHLIECGGQVSGGNHTDWQNVIDLSKVSYPLCKVRSDGQVSICLLDPSESRLTREHILEQVLYEIGNPAHYVLPDVICNFSELEVTEEEDGSVKIIGAKGLPAPEKLKVIETKVNGYRLSCPIVYVGQDADLKASRSLEAVMGKVNRNLARRSMEPISNYQIEVVGAGALSVTGILSAADNRKEVLHALSSEIASAALLMAPGAVSLLGGRKKPTSLIETAASYIDRKDINCEVHLEDEVWSVSHEVSSSFNGKPKSAEEKPPFDSILDTHRVALSELIYARSGDKGNDANIGIIARDERFFPFLCQVINDELIKKIFFYYIDDGSEIHFFPIKKLSSMNILMKDVLGGGGLSSLNIDSQAKGFASMLLAQEVEIPLSLWQEVSHG